MLGEDIHLDKIVSAGSSLSYGLVMEQLGWSLFSDVDNKSEGIQVPKNFMALVSSNSSEIALTTSYSKEEISMAPPEYQILAFPRADWRISRISPGARVLLIKLDLLHQIIGASYSSDQKEMQRFRLPDTPLVMNAKMRNALFDLFECKILGACGILYRESKIMEFFSLMLLDLQKKKPSIEHCPFLVDEEEVRKIEQVKAILQKEYNQPNRIRDLARRVGTNEFKLKVGFKELFGTTIHHFLVEQRMENARFLILEKKHKVGEISLLVGYSNPSHFIEAFKKKFGITPKKMLAS